jgi:hypothetical protein
VLKFPYVVSNETQLSLSLSPETVEALADALVPQLRANQPSETGWLAPQAAAHYLGVSRRRIHDLKHLGKLTPDGSDGRTPLYRQETLDRYARGES